MVNERYTQNNVYYFVAYIHFTMSMKAWYNDTKGGGGNGNQLPGSI